ncbi:MAG TPA: Bcr/CflA family multidrug efflux MFS transporter [Pseudonocardiaceae bacterium]|jgi:DHA1 family bicyclomycin/chloramphenicol resistance-like MFS transporter|nr:Bcr/CflA family multidrug efflux MFS transporter [Pseudonocardiaceae bacterium]
MTRSTSVPGHVDEPARRSARLVVILGALSAFGPLSNDMYLPAFPSISAQLHADASSVQLTLAACMVGLALGQLIAGPLSDSFGRRGPLLVGLAVFTVFSAVCALAPTVYVLTVVRFVQALGGAAGLVIANASVRDRYSGSLMSRFLSLLMLINGTAPILAPIIGGQLLRFTSWRGVFWTLTAIGFVLAVVSALWLEESLPVERRRPAHLSATLRAYRGLLTDRMFVGYALAGGMAFAAMFAYISGSSFVLQNVFGLSPQGFSLVFALNGLGIVLVGQVNGRLVRRVSSRRLLATGLCISATGGLLLLFGVLIGAGLPVVLPALFLVVSSIGLVAPNSLTMALADYASRAGTASSLVGVLQYIFGGLMAPVVGLAGVGTALPMALIIAVLPLGGLIIFRTMTGAHPPAAVPEETVERPS